MFAHHHRGASAPRTSVFLTGLALVLALSSALSAQEDHNAAEQEAALGEALAVELSFVATNEYFFRGIRQEDDGYILQPALDISLSLYEGDGFLKALAFNFGSWNSFHGGDSGSDGNNRSPGNWYESDFYAGLSAELAEGFSASLHYNLYVSPNGLWDRIEEFAFGVSFDDSSLWGEGFGGLQPSATIAFEIDGQADGGNDEGVYLELGIAPGFTLYESPEANIDLSLPVVLGLGLSDYFEGPSGDDSFGFLGVGAQVGVDLGFFGRRFGDWRLSLGPQVLFLGDANESFNAGNDTTLRFDVGLSVSW